MMEKSNEQYAHLEARLVVMEAVCRVIACQPGIKSEVASRLRQIISTCGEANKNNPDPNPAWPFEEHYLRRFLADLD